MIRTLNLQPRWFIRPKNTDWAHSLTLRAAINARSAENGLCMEMASVRATAFENMAYVRRAVRVRRRGAAFQEDDYQVHLPRCETATVDVIYACGRYVEPADGTPVVWHDGPSDEDLLRRGGWSEGEVAALRRMKQRAIKQCSRCLVSTDYGVRIFQEAFPEQASKVELAPFLLPHVHAATADHVSAKHRGGPVRLLFVGRQAHRKGLDLLLPAFAQVRGRFGPDATLDVVSSFDDGWKPEGAPEGVKFYREAPPIEVMSLMAKAHLFVMPSRVESYGIVYVEALSQGAVPVAVNREPQRSLLDGGRIGILTEPDEDALAHDLIGIVGDQSRRNEMALDGLRRFKAQFGFEAVRGIYERALVTAAGALSP